MRFSASRSKRLRARKLTRYLRSDSGVVRCDSFVTKMRSRSTFGAGAGAGTESADEGTESVEEEDAESSGGEDVSGGESGGGVLPSLLLPAPPLDVSSEGCEEEGEPGETEEDRVRSSPSRSLPPTTEALPDDDLL